MSSSIQDAGIAWDFRSASARREPRIDGRVRGSRESMVFCRIRIYSLGVSLSKPRIEAAGLPPGADVGRLGAIGGLQTLLRIAPRRDCSFEHKSGPDQNVGNDRQDSGSPSKRQGGRSSASFGCFAIKLSLIRNLIITRHHDHAQSKLLYSTLNGLTRNRMTYPKITEKARRFHWSLCGLNP